MSCFFSFQGAFWVVLAIFGTLLAPSKVIFLLRKSPFSGCKRTGEGQDGPDSYPSLSNEPIGTHDVPSDAQKHVPHDTGFSHIPYSALAEGERGPDPLKEEKITLRP